MLKSLALEFYRQTIAFAPRAFSGFCILAAFWISGSFLKSLIRHAGRKTRVDAGIIDLLGQICKMGVVLFGAVTAFGTMGVNVGALIAGLGLSSFALGFAFKDALSNLLAGVSLLFYRPFTLGDKISVTGFEGTVLEVNLRYTVLDAGDKRILVPNSNLFVNSVIVYRRNPSSLV